MDRRDFIKCVGAAAAAGAASLIPGSRLIAEGVTVAADRATTESLNAKINSTAKGKLTTRPFGKTGVQASILAFGGGMIHDVEEKDALAFINEMLDRGVNYLDTASSYGGGQSEIRLGKVLKSRRSEAFVATKMLQRSYKGTQAEFAESLRRLQTDYVDLVQIHAVNSQMELDAVFGPEGSLKTAIELQKSGKARWIGITGHTRPEIIAKALERHSFDAVLIPVGIGDTYAGDFVTGVIPIASRQGIAIIGMKILGSKNYLKDIGVSKCLRYSMNLPVSNCVIGMKTKQELDQAVAALADLKPLSDQELAEAHEKAEPVFKSGALWWKKV